MVDLFSQSGLGQRFRVLTGAVRHRLTMISPRRRMRDDQRDGIANNRFDVGIQFECRLQRRIEEIGPNLIAAVHKQEVARARQ